MFHFEGRSEKRRKEIEEEDWWSDEPGLSQSQRGSHPMETGSAGTRGSERLPPEMNHLERRKRRRTKEGKASRSCGSS